MSISSAIQTQVLTQALPYMQRYRDKIVVVNYSAGAVEVGEVMDAFVSDVVLLTAIGVKVVLVHGECTQMAGMLELFTAVNKAGGRGMTLCGVEKTAIEDVLGLKYIPIVAALDFDERGNAVKIGADMAAARISWELKAENLIAITKARGILRDQSDEGSLISQLAVSDVPYLTKQGIIGGGMAEKVDACVEAIRRGVKKACIIDGRIKHSILIEMFSDEGIGTLLV